MSLQAIQNRVKEFESSHMVEGGTHFKGGFCATCAVIKKLRGLERKYLEMASCLS